MDEKDVKKLIGTGKVYNSVYERVFKIESVKRDSDGGWLIVCRDNNRAYYFNDAECLTAFDDNIAFSPSDILFSNSVQNSDGYSIA